MLGMQRPQQSYMGNVCCSLSTSVILPLAQIELIFDDPASSQPDSPVVLDYLLWCAALTEVVMQQARFALPSAEQLKK